MNTVTPRQLISLQMHVSTYASLCQEEKRNPGSARQNGCLLPIRTDMKWSMLHSCVGAQYAEATQHVAQSCAKPGFHAANLSR